MITKYQAISPVLRNRLAGPLRACHQSCFWLPNRVPRSKTSRASSIVAQNVGEKCFLGMLYKVTRFAFLETHFQENYIKHHLLKQPTKSSSSPDFRGRNKQLSSAQAGDSVALSRDGLDNLIWSFPHL